MHVPALRAGPFSVDAFALLSAAGFLVGWALARRRAGRSGRDPAVLDHLAGWTVAGALAGGHLGYCLLYDAAWTARHPWQLLLFWDGLASFGAIAACTGLILWRLRSLGEPVLPWGDTLAMGLAPGLMVGRVGCFLVHDHPGAVTRFWLGAVGACGRGVDPALACHDLGLYEALALAAFWAVLLLLDRRPRPAGTLLGLLALLYGAARFSLDGLRVHDVRWLGLTPAQFGSAVLVAAGAWILGFRARRCVPGRPRIRRRG